MGYHSERVWLRNRLVWVILLGLGVCGSVAANPRLPRYADSFPASFTVFAGEESRADLVLPSNLPETLLAAVEEFRERVRAMGGGEISVVSEEEMHSQRGAAADPTIRFQKADFRQSMLFPPGADDRFLIAVDRRTLTIHAADPVGWEFGLYTLLDEFGGVRWFWPGEDGTHTPEKEAWRIAAGNYFREPAYVSRQFSGLRSAESREWARRNRLKASFHFHHNLRNVFTRDFYLAHPEALAVEWDPNDPPDAGDRIWKSHPDLTREVVVEAAAQAAIEDFRQNPDRTSFSLGLNDNTHFGESEGIQKWTRPMRYFRDLPDYSDLVFQFMNRVAARVKTEFPDRFLGCLAYMWNENVPGFPVEPMVLPYLTADRSQGHDVNFTESDRDLVRRWTQAGPRLVGIYDYIHGSPHPFPRRANLLIGQRLRDSREAGVRAFFGEFNPIWPLHGDVPWMVARMLWNPQQKPGRLEEEFMETFFGPAAPSMKAFYDRAREVWMRQDGTAVWIKFYKDEAGVELFGPDDLAYMTRALAEARAAALTGVEADRVDAVRNAWELTLAAARLQRARRSLVEPDAVPGDVAPIYELLAARKNWESVGRDLSSSFLTRNAAGTRYPHSDPSYHATRLLLEGLPAESVRPTLEGLHLEAIRLGDPGARVIFRLAEAAARAPAMTPLVAGPLVQEVGPLTQTGPESWEITVDPPWELRANPSERVSVDFVQVGDREALRIRDAYAVGLLYHFDLPPDSAGNKPSAYEAAVDLRARISPGNRTQIEFRWWDGDDRFLGISRAMRLPSAEEETRGTFRTFGYPPSTAVRGALMVSVVRQETGDVMDIFSVDVSAFPLR